MGRFEITSEPYESGHADCRSVQGMQVARHGWMSAIVCPFIRVLNERGVSMADSSGGVGAAPWQDQGTPLHLAVQEGHLEAARALLEAKADVDARTTVRVRVESREEGGGKGGGAL